MLLFCSGASAGGAPAPRRPAARTATLLGIPHADDLADQRGLLLPLDLDRHLRCHARAVPDPFPGADDPLPRGGAGPRLHRADEADLVRAVVDPAAPMGH